MFVSKQGLDLIKEFEGCKLKAYLCPAGVWTIGYGHTKGVYPGMVITQELADKYLIDDVWNFEREVESLVHVPITQGMFDALVSFAFNMGSDIDEDDIPEGLGDSTLLKHLNLRHYILAADEFPKWANVRNKKNGKLEKSPGLVRRRAAERRLFLSDYRPDLGV